MRKIFSAVFFFFLLNKNVSAKNGNLRHGGNKNEQLEKEKNGDSADEWTSYYFSPQNKVATTTNLYDSSETVIQTNLDGTHHEEGTLTNDNVTPELEEQTDTDSQLKSQIEEGADDSVVAELQYDAPSHGDEADVLLTPADNNQGEENDLLDPTLSVMEEEEETTIDMNHNDEADVHLSDKSSDGGEDDMAPVNMPEQASHEESAQANDASEEEVVNEVGAVEDEANKVEAVENEENEVEAGEGEEVVQEGLADGLNEQKTPAEETYDKENVEVHQEETSSGNGNVEDPAGGKTDAHREKAGVVEEDDHYEYDDYDDYDESYEDQYADDYANIMNKLKESEMEEESTDKYKKMSKVDIINMLLLRNLLSSLNYDYVVMDALMGSEMGIINPVYFL
ncbi:hypothetical protein POVWA2_015030 [Plasmodium ovale wallikeri]|uniref:Merozoite surface protein 3 n=2 Tax=Plasmodium ovale TaxID=36330 RepID=A0A1A8YQK5_PLAOA|nr:hypothetical protein POVWA2_015030 [Plasmodium ovale wallikeri]SBT33906.1 hypothetical protein POVWA1_019480 [Plasmodium ovale wallikeri]SBT76190.1 hypothetical protein, conserved [Plasmodium ovale]